MDNQTAKRLLAQLAEHGVPPQDIATAGLMLPMFSVGVDAWIERIARIYLQDLSRSGAHFKVVLAPYGGGKTHFLMALAVRALSEDFAVSYVQCVPDRQGAPVRVDNPLGLYAEAVGRLSIKGQEGQGVPALLTAVVRAKRQAIESARAPDPDSAFGMYLRSLRQAFGTGIYGDFAHVVSHALRGYWDWDGGELSDVAKAAEKWLEGRMDSLNSDEFNLLGLHRVTRAQQDALGRKLMQALAKFTRDAGCQGLALLIDEVETLFTAKGKALQAVLGAMRVMVDWSGAAPDAIPLFCVFAATPDIFEGIIRYPALQQRLAVAGATFDEGNNYAPRISLERIDVKHEQLLIAIGERLVNVAMVASNDRLTRSLQLKNSVRLARTASQRSLGVDARRLFVKTWAGILAQQIEVGEREFSEDELTKRYTGDFDDIATKDKQAFEP